MYVIIKTDNPDDIGPVSLSCVTGRINQQEYIAVFINKFDAMRYMLIRRYVNLDDIETGHCIADVSDPNVRDVIATTPLPVLIAETVKFWLATPLTYYFTWHGERMDKEIFLQDSAKAAAQALKMTVADINLMRSKSAYLSYPALREAAMKQIFKDALLTKIIGFTEDYFIKRREKKALRKQAKREAKKAA